jgi:hypothetical protein
MVTEDGSRSARMPTHAMRPHEWGTQGIRGFMCGPPAVVLRPYFLLGGGVATSTFKINDITGPAAEGLTTQPTRFTSGGVEFAGGLDVRLSDSFDLRAVELGAVAGASNQGVGSAFLDAGLVYHLHKRSHKL